MAIPLNTLLLRMVFWTRRVPEYLIIAFHLHAFAMLCLAGEGIVLRLAATFNITSFVAPALLMLVPLAFALHFYTAMRRVHPYYDVVDTFWRTAAFVLIYGVASTGIGSVIRAVLRRL